MKIAILPIIKNSGIKFIKFLFIKYEILRENIHTYICACICIFTYIDMMPIKLRETKKIL